MEENEVQQRRQQDAVATAAVVVLVCVWVAPGMQRPASRRDKREGEKRDRGAQRHRRCMGASWSGLQQEDGAPDARSG